MMRRPFYALLALMAIAPAPARPQAADVAPGDNLVTKGIPPIPGAIAEEARRYSQLRTAAFWDWHPTRREMLIGTRFGDAQQLHVVRFPGGARTQLTFFPDPVSGASYQPTRGEYIVFSKDVGGAEFFQKYRYDVATGEVTLLTDGKSRNGGGAWPHAGDRYAYMSTRRDGRDLDLWVINPAEPRSDRMVAQLEGGGHAPVDWSADGKLVAFVVNEDGVGVLRVMRTATDAEVELPKLPVGLISSLRWRGKTHDLGFTFSSARSNGDAYSLDLAKGTLTRWTESETGGVRTASFSEPELVHWASFDGRAISGFLYKPPARFAGRRPVIVNIHGGPEGQSRPGFIGRNNYYVNELGIAIVYPNIRGSAGYGKTFVTLDNGVRREDAYKDIGALLDWIRTRPDLDAERVLVTGGSYGGHMTLVTATRYDERICCSVDVVGISNLATFLQNTSGYRQDLRRVEYGDERDSTTRAWMERSAPLNNADRVTKPLFVVQGMNDPRVPRSEAEQMVAALERRNVPVWYLMARDEGHGFQKKANVDFQFYATILFVKKYLLRQSDSRTVGQ